MAPPIQKDFLRKAVQRDAVHRRLIYLETNLCLQLRIFRTQLQGLGMDVVYARLIPVPQSDRPPDSAAHKARTPVPTKLICRLSSERRDLVSDLVGLIARWQAIRMLSDPLFVVFNRRLKVDLQRIPLPFPQTREIDPPTAEHIVRFQDE
ncbi:MAG: Uncharacterised protein [Flavobacteriia bacterium]|nr:MAG: Uncharacterised protein [Flavobacteriia bacterium]